MANRVIKLCDDYDLVKKNLDYYKDVFTSLEGSIYQNAIKECRLGKLKLSILKPEDFKEIDPITYYKRNSALQYDYKIFNRCVENNIRDNYLSLHKYVDNNTNDNKKIGKENRANKQKAETPESHVMFHYLKEKRRVNPSPSTGMIRTSNTRRHDEL